MKKIFFLVLFISCFWIGLVQAIDQPYTSGTENRSAPNRDTTTVLSELKSCQDKYEQGMKTKFDSYKVLVPTEAEQNSCDFSSTRSKTDTLDNAEILYGAYESIDISDCDKLVTTDTPILTKCINASDFISLSAYHAILSAYKFCAVQYSANLNSANNQTLASVMSDEQEVISWVDEEIKDSQLKLSVALQIHQEERQAAQIIEPICRMTETLNNIRLLALDIRKSFIKWIPALAKRQLKDGQ